MCGDCKEGKCAGSCVVKMVAKILVIVGGINWGLVGIGMFFGLNLNLVNLVFGFSSMLEAIVYILVGVSAVVMLGCCKCKKCVGVCDTEEVVEKPAEQPVQ